MSEASNSSAPLDRLENYRVYQAARELFQAFWDDAQLLLPDVRGRELVRQQTRSLDSICANIEEGYGRGFGKEFPQHLKIARGEARESQGRYQRMERLLTPAILNQRIAALDFIIGGLTKTIQTIESRRAVERLSSPAPRPPSLE
ncbi:MAG: four helix bundle protein [Limisphaerales bacterium]